MFSFLLINIHLCLCGSARQRDGGCADSSNIAPGGCLVTGAAIVANFRIGAATAVGAKAAVCEAVAQAPRAARIQAAVRPDC